jgi:capsular polysaccharide export protein
MTAPGSRNTGEKRSFLFLQGPLSDFFDRLGRALIARGHRVHRVNLNLGDRLFWHLPAVNFRGPLSEWRGFIARELEAHAVTDLILLGDRRPYHLAAAEEARARGITVICTELGYVRPDWLTLEYDGMSTFSRMPRDPEVIAGLAKEFPEPDLEPRFHAPFRLVAALDVAYNLAEVFGLPFYPHYRRHAISHPFAEYAGWIVTLVQRSLHRQATSEAKARLEAAAGSYFLFPLQLATDYQIRAHSPYADARDAVREVVASFARSGADQRLVFVIHPLDNGLVRWRTLIMHDARRRGIADRVAVLDGGTPPGLMRKAAGIVTVNSTVGITALRLGTPVKVLGSAVFDIPGLTCQAPLDAFWRDPIPPDPDSVQQFLRVLIGTTQVKGGYYERVSQSVAVAGFVDRLECRPYPLPPLSAAELAARQPRPIAQIVAVVGVSDLLGAALARARATPGVKLHLIDASAAALSRIADDCRYRGAVIETHQCGVGPLGPVLTAIEQDDGIDTLIVAGDGGVGSPASLPAARDLLGAMDAVAAVSGGMRRRGSGEIVLAGGGIGQPMGPAVDPIDAARAAAALRAYAGRLRLRLRKDGITVAVIIPSAAALRFAARWGMPDLATFAGDAAAARVGDARARVVALPGLASLAWRALLRLPSRFGDAASGSLLFDDDPSGKPAEAALRRETARAD